MAALASAVTQILDKILFRIDLRAYHRAMDQFRQIVEDEPESDLKRDGQAALVRIKVFDSKLVAISGRPFSQIHFEWMMKAKEELIIGLFQDFQSRSLRQKLQLADQELETALSGVPSQSKFPSCESQGDEIVEDTEEATELTAMESSITTFSSVTPSVAEGRFTKEFWTNILENLIPRQVAGSEDAQSRDSEQDHIDPLNEAWVFDRHIGSGAYGTVDTAISQRQNNNCVFVVKRVRVPTPAIIQKIKALQNECRILEGLRHRNILLYLGSKNVAEGVQLYTEYVPGTIFDMVSTLGPITEPQCVPVLKQVGAGTAYLHENNLVHQDIKGANILINDMGCIKLADFGTTKCLGAPSPFEEEGSHVSLKGTIRWMSPEIVAQRGGYTGKADIWSIGCLIIEMLTGAHPWPDQSQTQVLFSIAKGETPPLPPCSIALSNLFSRIFVGDLERYTCAELLDSEWLNL